MTILSESVLLLEPGYVLILSRNEAAASKDVPEGVAIKVR
jgi:hypothetical protein